jgi:hypothetical protein
VELHRHRPRDEHDHRDHDKIVELTRVPTRFEADVLVAALESRGIKASAIHSDSSGWTPHYATFTGHRVMVFEGDFETARAILEQPGVAGEGTEPAG